MVTLRRPVLGLMDPLNDPALVGTLLSFEMELLLLTDT
jgi:hypothetical protein